MSGVRTAASAASVPGIPTGARKMVQSLKEIVGHGEEEIYAMLKECNMDPNETAQRLMSQDTFHEVKRKRDKKKEASSNNKDAFEIRSRPAGAFRGGRGDRGAGRGGSLSRNTSNEFGNGRGKPWPVRENGSHFSGASTTPSAADSNPPKPAPALSGSSGLTGASPGIPNGYTPNASATQGTWVKVATHGTMADMLKANGSHAPPNVVNTGAPSNTLQTFSSGMYSSSDPVHHPSPDHRASGGVNAIKREIGIVGNQRPIGDRSSASFGGSLPSPSHPSHAHVSTSEDDEVRAASPPAQQEIPKSQDSLSDRSNASEVLHQSSGLPVSRSLAVGNGRLTYQQQQSSNVQKSTGANLEWKPKLVPQDVVSVPGLNTVESVVTEALKSPPASAIAESDVVSVTSNFEDLTTRDEQQVIMPNNIQSQGDLGLSFGSFGESFGSSLPSGFSSEDGLDLPDSNETAPAKDVLREQSSSGADAGTPDSASMHQIDIPVQLDDLTSRNDSTSASLSTTFTSQAEMSKLRSAQQAQQYSYLQSPNYSSLGMVPQIPSSQHGFESSESHLQDMPSAPSSMKQQHYTDPATSYYSPAFRPGSDGDARYPQYLPGSAAAKYNVMPGQHLPSTQEVGNSAALSSSSTTSQAPQTGHTHSMPTAPQQPLPVHAYPAQPAGVPLGHFANVFGYQYPSYTFVPTPYQHSYTTSYPQPPVSSYPPSANYAPGGVAAVKYTLPQYKPGNATANAPLSAATAGYGGYGTASSMYAGNPTATATNTSGYEDASGGQYKDSNLYVHGPQGEGARLWIQSQLSGDVAAAQTSSFYALSGQNQHTSYTQPNNHTHPMAGYTSLYHHPSQPGPAASAHQLIQQPQTLSGAAGSTQVGATYQQLQRMQPNWNAY